MSDFVRPDVGYTFSYLRDSGNAKPTCNIEESLSKFGTVTIGIQFMIDTIYMSHDGGQMWTPGQATGGVSIECGYWLHFVPLCYRAGVMDTVLRVFELHKGYAMARPDDLRDYIEDLNRELNATLVPVRP